MRRVALTGGIATGKSYVRECFADLGVPTLDADGLARSVVAAETPGLAAVVTRFGPAVLDATGTLDRSKLAATVFADEAADLSPAPDPGDTVQLPVSERPIPRSVLWTGT